MHQSRMFSIQRKYSLAQRSGKNSISPSRTASTAGSASGSISTNHCREISGSITASERSEIGTLIV